MSIPPNLPPVHDGYVPPDQRGDVWHEEQYHLERNVQTARLAGPPILTCSHLLDSYPTLRPALIDGLLRVGETMNVIAAPKVGKSWLTLGLAFAVGTGRPWLDTFSTTQGSVLLIDNELHPETIAHRLRTMANTLHVDPELLQRISVVSLRGRLQDLMGMGSWLRAIERGRFQLAVIDAWYRTLPQGADENDNATMAGLYNALDSYADTLASSFVLIHHASKGSQSAKAVTDVGSGAGSQSRATDTHLILRPHEETNAVVLDAAVRSWPPVASVCLRWEWPLWTPAPELDPLALRQPKPRSRKPEGHEPPAKSAEPPWTAQRFAEAFGSAERKPRAAVLEAAQLAGLSDRKAHELCKRAIDLGLLHSWREEGQANRWVVSNAPPSIAKPKRRSKARKK
jgi:hypothetical protein